MPVRYCIWTLLVLLAVPASARQLAPEVGARQLASEVRAQQPEPEITTGYTIFLRGIPVGREDVTVRQDADGITLSAKGRLSAPVNLLTRRVEVRYKPDWTPESVTIDANVNGGDTTLTTSFAGGTTQSEGTVNGET